MRSGPIGDSQRMPPPTDTRISSNWIPSAARKALPASTEDDALDAQAGDDREDDLVVEDELLAAADDVAARSSARTTFGGMSSGHLSELPSWLMNDVVARAERAHLEAADRVDAAGEVALEQRQLGLAP